MAGFEFDAPPSPGTNRAAAPTHCRTCHGDRFVTVRLRSPEQTAWMNDRGLRPRKDVFHEEVAPCPDCHRVEITYWVSLGPPFRVMDPAAVRQAIAP